MSSDYFDSSTVNVPAYTTADSSDVNNVSAAVDTGFQKLPAPRSDAPTNKGFSEHFTVVSAVVEDDTFSVKQYLSFDLNHGTDTGSTNAYAMTLSPAVSAYADGQTVVLIPANTNTSSSCTLSLNGLSNIPMVRRDGTSFASGDIVKDGVYHFTYSNGKFYGDAYNSLQIDNNTISAGTGITVVQSGSGPYDYAITKELTVQEEGVDVKDNVTILNFEGAGVTAINPSGTTAKIEVLGMTMPSGVRYAGDQQGLDSSYTTGTTYTVTKGSSWDTTKRAIGILSADMVKTLGTAWVAGTGNGGLLAGTLTASKMYFIWVLIKDSDGTIDIGHLAYDADIASNLPSGYSTYQFIDAFYTDSSSNISEFATVDGLHRNFIIADSIGQNLSSVTSYTLMDCSSRLPSSDYVSEVLLGGNAGSSTSHALYFVHDSSASYFDWDMSTMNDNYLSWIYAANDYGIPPVPNIPWYVKQSGAYSASILIHQFKIRR